MTETFTLIGLIAAVWLALGLFVVWGNHAITRHRNNLINRALNGDDDPLWRDEHDHYDHEPEDAA